MIILDTDVLSALMRTRPDDAVVAWLDHQPAESIWLTVITLFEVRFGLARLAAGARPGTLEAAFERLVDEDLENRILDFDRSAAVAAATLAAEREKNGRPVDIRDTQVAGIAVARRATLATRNTRHFGGLEVPVVDPWRA